MKRTLAKYAYLSAVSILGLGAAMASAIESQGEKCCATQDCGGGLEAQHCVGECASNQVCLATGGTTPSCWAHAECGAQP